MSSSSIAKRYATALFQLSKEHQLLNQMEEELRVVKKIVADNGELMELFKSPKLSIDKKKEMLKETFSALHPFVLNTLMILIDRHREDYIADMVDQFIGLANEDRGIAEAQVYSTRPLTDEERQALSATFAAKVGKKSLQINNIVDSNLLGGIKVRIGNRIYDGSVLGKLQRLERQLLG